MSGPSWCSTSFDLAAAPRSCSRSKVPTLGMSLSMTNLRSAIATSHKQPPHELLSYEAFGLGAIRVSLTRQGIPEELGPLWGHGQKNSSRAFLVGSTSVTGICQPTLAVTLRAKGGHRFGGSAGAYESFPSFGAHAVQPFT